jgi:hypothetical protein
LGLTLYLIIELIYSFLSTAQLEEVLDPYLANTNIGIPYWDWTNDSSVPDVWEDILSPIKAEIYI